MTAWHPDGPGSPPARPAARPAWARVRERLTMRVVALLLVGVGLTLCLVPIAIVGYGMWEENQLTDRWNSAETATLPSPPFIEEGTPSSDPAALATPTPAPSARSRGPSVPAVFAMRVPKIGYSAAVREGVSSNILATGPGHYPATVLPGQTGLVGIAAHNTFWIPFGQLGAGDTIVLEARTGERFTYRITGTRIVNPDDRTVLVPTTDPRLVLTTCWPLWAGNLATQRLAIFAQEI